MRKLFITFFLTLLSIFNFSHLIACNADFEIEILSDGTSNIPPYINTFNTSTDLSEDAEFNWTVYADGELLVEYPFENIDYLISSSALYEICLEVIDGDCNSSHCETIELEDFEQWNCSLELESFTNSSGQLFLTAFPSDPTAQIYWEIGGETYEGVQLNLNFEEDFEGEVCAFYETPACPLGITECIEVNVNYPDCPDDIIALPAPSCYSYYFELNNDASGNALWDFSDAGAEGSGVSIDHTFPGPGVYTVCATPLSMDCSPICIEIEVPECNNCELLVEYDDLLDCGLFVFEAYDFADNAQVQWYVDDEFITEGEVATVLFEENGTHQICAEYENEQCPLGVSWCETVEVNCFDDCEENQIGIGIDSFVEEGGPVFIEWELSNAEDEIELSGIAQYSAQDPYFDEEACLPDGCYELEMFSNTLMSWENVLVSITVNGQDLELLYGSSNGYSTRWTLPVGDVDCQPDCGAEPSYYFGENGEVVFENLDAEDDLGYSWSIDGELLADGPTYTTFLEPGSYTVCLQVYSSYCDNEICMELTIPGNDCPEQLWFGQGEECGHYLFETSNFQQGEEVIWDFGDGTTLEGGHFEDHHYSEPGVYIVTALFSSDACPLGVTLTATVQVPECESDCPDTIWAGQGDECGEFIFEIGSNSPGVEVIWYFGDGNSEWGGHYMEHTYEEPGEYFVNVGYFSDNCPDGVDLSTQIEVPDCEEEDDCTPVSFAFDSFMVSNGPEEIEYELVNAFGESMLTGSAEYTENDQYHDDLACLPDGCYEMIIEGSSTLEGVEFMSQAFVGGVPLHDFDVYYGENSMSYEFSINSDCNPNCTEIAVTLYVDPASENSDHGFEIYNTLGNAFSGYGNMDGLNESGLQTFYYCLPDGCYYIQYDGEENLQYGEELIFFGSDNITFGEFDEEEQTIPLSINGGCEWDIGCEPVQLTVSGNFVGEALVEWVLESEEFELNGLLPLDALLNGEFVLDWCLPEECFSLAFHSDGPLPMEALLLELYAEELQEELGAFEMTFGDDFILFEFGFEESCFTSVAERETADFRIYPNPNSGQFTIEMAAIEKTTLLRVYDLSGRMVHEEQIQQSNKVIDLSGLAAGMYELQLSESGYHRTQKMIIQH